MAALPYVLAVVSHKGGTGRTTAAVVLAWCWAQAGRRVTLVDADPIHAASLLAAGADGRCAWPNVTFRRGADALADPGDAELVVIDSPSLMDPQSMQVLQKVDGLVLTCLADPLSLRTIPAAASIIERAKASNPRLELLGILIGIYNERDEVQSAMLSRLQEAHRDLLLQPAVPFQAEVRRWALQPGSAPPEGTARDAFVALTRSVDPWLRAGREA